MLKIKLRSAYRITAVFLCSYCPVMVSETETWIEKQTVERKPKEVQEKHEGNNWVGVFDFFPSEGNWEKSKTPT
jgi:hypothetical protein